MFLNSNNIANSTPKRLFFYTLCLIPSCFLLIQKIQYSKFNVDEFQHNYLAWSTAFLNQVQYRDMWDNHGILYTLFNSLMLKIFQPEIGLPTLFFERYCSLGLLMISFFILLELMFIVFKRPHYACLGGLLLTLSSLNLKAIEIRPDNLQCVFLYLSLVLLFKSLESPEPTKISFQKMAFGAGLSACLMLMVNLKSFSALLAIFMVLIVTLFFSKSKKHLNTIINMGAGLGLGLIAFALGFMACGLLDEYIKYNFIFIFKYNHLFNNKHNVLFDAITAQKYYQNNNLEKALDFFLHDNFFISTIVISSLLIFLLDSFFINKRNFLQKMILMAIIISCLITRFFGYIYRLQFDLMYFPLACMLASYVFFRLVESLLPKRFQKIVIVALLSLLSVLYYQSLKNINADKEAHGIYLDVFQKRFLAVSSYPTEYIDYYTADNCPGFGFSKNVSFLFFKYKKAMITMEEIEKKEIYGQSYIDLLESKKVKLIISTPKGINENPYLITRQYIFDNYKYYGCIWERVTPFPYGARSDSIRTP